MVIANYGYQDGSGEYYITIDTDRCDGCGLCAEACSEDLFEMVTDDYDELAAMVKPKVATQIGYLCRAADCGYKCHEACQRGAISHSW